MKNDDLQVNCAPRRNDTDRKGERDRKGEKWKRIKKKEKFPSWPG